jgi:hypothetical protein
VRSVRRAAACLVCLAPLALTGAAGAEPPPSKEACSAAYERTQVFDRESALVQAREQSILCAKRECPEFVQKECLEWLEDLDARIPTILIEAYDRVGARVDDVTVLFDGVVLARTLDGVEMRVDPGAHQLTFQRRGERTVIQDITLRERDKRKIVVVRFSPSPADAAPTASASASAAPAGSGAPAGTPAMRVAAYVTGATAFASLVAAVSLGAVAVAEQGELAGRCSPKCSSGEIEGLRGKAIAADVLGVAGLAMAGVATYLFLAPTSRPAAAPVERLTLGAWAAPQAGGFVVQGAF